MSPSQIARPSAKGSASRSTRREFIRAASVAAGGLALGARPSAEAQSDDAGLPTRILGRTGLEVSILSLGLGAAGDGKVDPGIVREIVNTAIDGGVNYIDEAPNYGSTQRAIRPIMAQRRDEVFLASKVEEQTRQGALAQIEQTRRDIQVDELDVLLIHNLGDFDPEEMMGPEGAFTALREARDAGWVRFLGVSGHNRPSRFAPVIRTGEVDVVMLPMNFVDRHIYNFEEKVPPAAREQNCGIICMKVLGGVPGWNYRNVGHANLAEHYTDAVRYALTLPDPATATMGLCTLDEVHTALETVRAFEPLTDRELSDLLARGKDLAPRLGHHYGPPT